MKSFSNIAERIFEELEERNPYNIDVIHSPPKQQFIAEKNPSQEEEKSVKKASLAEMQKKKKNSSYSKWTEVDKKNFWLKNLEEMIRYPQKIHSWNHWKPDRYFHQMAKFLGTKTADQCKSFDQRMKKRFFLSGKHPIDLPQATVLSLEPYGASDQVISKKLYKFKLRMTGHSDVDAELSGKGFNEDKSQNVSETQEFRNYKLGYMRAIEKYIQFFMVGQGKEKFDQLQSSIAKYQLS